MIAGNSGDIPFVGVDRMINWEHGVRTVQIQPNRRAFKAAKIFENRRVLVVSAEVISGASLHSAAELARQCGASSVKTACFVRLQTSSFCPDHFVYLTNYIVQMPWRFTRYYRNQDDKIRQ